MVVDQRILVGISISSVNVLLARSNSGKWTWTPDEITSFYNYFVCLLLDYRIRRLLAERGQIPISSGGNLILEKFIVQNVPVRPSSDSISQQKRVIAFIGIEGVLLICMLSYYSSFNLFHINIL